MKSKAYAVSFILLGATLLLPSCGDYKHDTVSFHIVGKSPASITPAPAINIDTNMSVSSMMGGTVKSQKPYDILAYYLDDTFTIESAVFTKVTVTYADGTVDPGAVSLKLPLKITGRLHESPNSMAGGAVVVTKSRIIQAEFTGAISRDEPFTLLIEGHFNKNDGTTIPFTINEKYDITRDKRTETWSDFVSGC